MLCIIALVSSCAKDENPELIKASLVVKKDLTPEEVIMKEKLALTAQIVRDVIIDAPEVVKEVGSLINLRMYKDDFILFKDLFNPEENSIIKGSTPSTKFGKVFDIILERKSNSNINFDIKKFLVASEITLYCPYPTDDYPAAYQIPSVTSDPIDNEYENIGYQLENDGSYSEIIVNEEYSEDYPVWIVTQEDSYTEENNPTVNTNTSIYQLRVGSVKCTKQYDGIFGGGSEFKFCLLGGTITLNSATTFASLQSINLTRAQIRNHYWIDFQYELDDDWYVSEDGTTNEGGRQFGLIEFDKNKSEFTLSFEPKVKIDKIEVSAGKVELKIDSEEGWIKLDNYLSRDNFYSYNKVDMGQGLYNSFRIFTAGNVYWTLPLVKY